MLPIEPDYAPMEAQLVETLPEGAGWQYEPKWDGFRCLVFRDGDKVELKSKTGRILERYFPEVAESVRALLPAKFVLDGEIVIPHGADFSFDLLLQRIHPAASRIKKLARETPAVLIVFDILVDEQGQSCVEEVLSKRRSVLTQFAKKHLEKNKSILLSPASDRFSDVDTWRAKFHNKLDGIVAKRTDLPYQSANRKGMVKMKWMRSADCVIGGFRYASGDEAKGSEAEKSIGSLLLGLYDEQGLLHHVGFCSSFNAKAKKELAKKLEPLIEPPGFTGQAPGGPSRWSTERSAQWQPLGGGLVAEFRYDHFSDGRFRHGTKFLRWRPDKDAKQCTYDQIR
jgi:ATP-dependent DNA ligase